MFIKVIHDRWTNQPAGYALTGPGWLMWSSLILALCGIGLR